MAKITWLANSCLEIAQRHDHLADLRLLVGNRFYWDSSATKITYDPNDQDAPANLLHEVGHAILNHSTYTQDISLLHMERAAWSEAGQLAEQLGIIINDDLVEDSLDTYRDWLHSRSTCPNCEASGIQVARQVYYCLACFQKWHVNDARNCALRRYKI